LRKDLLRKVQRYDAKLLNVLLTFQAALTVDGRFALLALGPMTGTDNKEGAYVDS